MLNGMMITKPEGSTSLWGMLLRFVFIRPFAQSNPDIASPYGWTGDDDAIDAFMNALADRVVHGDVDRVFDSRIVCVVGSSGSGKTTLATKIAAYFKEHGISDRMTLAAATGPGISCNEDIKAYARLLNMRSTQFGIGELATAVQETSNRMVIDITASPEDAMEAIRDVHACWSAQSDSYSSHSGGSSAP